MTASYPQASLVAQRIVQRIDASPIAFVEEGSAPRPDAEVIEQVIDAAFWASLLHEEGRAPKITLAYVPPPEPEHALVFAQTLALSPHVLAHLAPSVERPGIHLGVWHFDSELRIWGLTRLLPFWCFVLEVAAPGLLIVKYR